MGDWIWSDPRWRDRVGDDPATALREAVRRAVDLRDSLATADRDEAGRAVFLVDVLNHPAAALASTVRRRADEPARRPHPGPTSVQPSSGRARLAIP